MTSFTTDSIVQNDGSIILPALSFQPGTVVHVVVTTNEHTEEKYSIDELLESLDGLLIDCDADAIENARLDYLTEKYQ